MAGHPALAVQTVDKDGDGSITHEEYLDVAVKFFLAADENYDGYVEGNETRKLTGLLMEADSVYRFPKTDLDGDGMISVTEMLAASEKRAEDAARKRREADKPYDLNGDGRLDAEESVLKSNKLMQEFKARREAAKAKAEAAKARNGGSEFKPIQTIEGLITPRSRPHMDSDQDQKVSLLEYRVGMGERFDEKDADGDRVISSGEMPDRYLFWR